MAKISIVGVEGSGKTVLMAVLGDKYKIAKEDGETSLEPTDFATMWFVKHNMAELCKGCWPKPSLPDQTLKLSWNIHRKSGTENPVVGTFSSLDFGGEVYRSAFGGKGSPHQSEHQEQVAALKEHIAESDCLVVLVNLTDIVNGDLSNERTVQSIWLSMSILGFVEQRHVNRVAIALSQYENYRTMVETYGGPAAAVRHYIPELVNAYGHLPLFPLTAVNKTVPGADGRAVPAPDFASEGLDALVDWMLEGGPVRGKPDVPEKDVPPQEKSDSDLPRYRVVDLASGQVTGLDAVPPDGWTNEHKTVKLVLRRIDPCTFTMGSQTNEAERGSDEKQHRVTLTKPYYIGVFEVTQGQWERVMGNRPSWFQPTSLGRIFLSKKMRRVFADLRPVECISWDDCQAFCRKAGHGFRLPTEAEWENACRAGTTTAYSWGNALNGDHANCNGRFPCGTTTNGPYKKETTDVGSYAPNAWGLYDMHGNVWELCADWYGGYGGDATDPTGPASGESRVCRGGGWRSSARYCRSAYRSRNWPGSSILNLGFRLCCSAKPSE